jgi:mono/diheme cytochrome c family protein
MWPPTPTLLRRSSARRLALAAVALLVVCAAGAASVRAQQADDSDGWKIPAGAAAEINPVPASPAALAKGKDLYKSKCQRCHGVTGTGNGPDAERDHSPGDLTDGSRAPRNPDGVMFYKIWNGRSKPKMPAFKSDLSRPDVWSVVMFAKSLRK